MSRPPMRFAREGFDVTNTPRLLAMGGAHIDRRGRLSGPHIPATSNPGHMREDVGGGVLNAARCAVQRGIHVSLFSVRGGDAGGERVTEAIAASGIEDLSCVFLDRTTPSYTAILDDHGELITGLADMELYERAFPRQMRRRKLRDAIAGVDALLCDANMPTEAIAALAAQRDARLFGAIAVSPAKAGRLLPSLRDLSVLFMNGREARALAGLDETGPLSDAVLTLEALGLSAGVITAGSDRILLFDQNGIFGIEPPAIDKVADVTGAGDALAGATMAALMNGESLSEAVRHGIAGAGIAIGSASAAPEFDNTIFSAALARVPAARAVS